MTWTGTTSLPRARLRGLCSVPLTDLRSQIADFDLSDAFGATATLMALTRTEIRHPNLKTRKPLCGYPPETPPRY